MLASHGLKETRFGCGIAQCGACTVHVDGTATRSCITVVADVEGKEITTIEGLSEDGTHPLHTLRLANRLVALGGQHLSCLCGLVRAQVEGGFVYGLSAALFGELTVEDGAMSRATSIGT